MFPRAVYANIGNDVDRVSRRSKPSYVSALQSRLNTSSPVIYILTAACIEPLSDALSKHGQHSFHFTQGTTPTEIPKGFDNFFGPPPNFTFLETTNQANLMRHLRHFPHRDTPEETLRYAVEKGGIPVYHNIQVVLKQLSQVVEQEDVDGIIGYSEGGRLAASLLLEEERRLKETGRQPRIKFAVFFGGWQPVHPISQKDIFADESEERITIPTCHVIGTYDPYLQGSLCLYNFCDPEKAELFDHGAGHVVPRERRVVQELAETIQEMLPAC